MTTTNEPQTWYFGNSHQNCLNFHCLFPLPLHGIPKISLWTLFVYKTIFWTMFFPPFNLKKTKLEKFLIWGAKVKEKIVTICKVMSSEGWMKKIWISSQREIMLGKIYAKVFSSSSIFSPLKKNDKMWIEVVEVEGEKNRVVGLLFLQFIKIKF